MSYCEKCESVPPSCGYCLATGCPKRPTATSSAQEDLWVAVRLLAEGSDLKRDQGETLTAWAQRTIKQSASGCFYPSGCDAESRCKEIGQCRYKAARSATAPGWEPTPEQPHFDEAALVSEIAKVWGLYGAHMEVYRMALRDAARYRWWRENADEVFVGEKVEFQVKYGNLPAQLDDAVDEAMTADAADSRSDK